jgi:hypothetical protein
MMKWISTCVIAAAFAVSAHAQDSTVTTRTQVKADDAKAITATGCIVPGLAPGAFALRGAIAARGEEVTTKTQTRTEVDRDESRVQTETRTKAEGDGERVKRGTAVLYNLSPRAGVDLTAHIGQQVQLTAIVLERGKDDAEVEIKEETKVDREDGKDGKSTTESKITVDRGEGPRLNVLSVKSLGQPCQ